MISVIFYCFAINDWKNRLERQIKRLKSSGLYDRADEIFLFVTDPSDNLQKEIEIMLYDFKKINLSYTNINYGEAYLALCKLEELAKEDKDRKLLYFHTKGVFNKYKNFETKEIDELKTQGVDCWVDMMEFFLIDNWNKCENLLDNNDIVGLSCHGFWWWGNFWWTKSSHVKKIPSIKKVYNGSRWSVEAWIHESAPKKENTPYYEMNHINFDPCYTFLPKYFYNKTIDIEKIKINIKKAEYGYFAEQRDEGRQIPSVKGFSIDVTNRILQMIKDDPKKLICIDQIINKEDINILQKEGVWEQQKSLRVFFETNIEPEKVYTATSFGNQNLKFFS